MSNLNLLDCLSLSLLTDMFGFYPVLIAICLSVMIDIRAKKNIISILTGAMICGFISFSAIHSLEYFGISEKSGFVVGSIIGLVGADRIQRICIVLITKKIRTKNR